MHNKKKKALIGILLLLFGAATLAQHFININYGSLLFLLFGISLVVLFKTKKKTWALSIGAYLTAFTMYSIMRNIFSLKFNGIIFFIILFIAQGIIFLVLYYEKNKLGLKYPASFLIWFGIFLLFLQWNDGIFLILALICGGLSFLTIYLIGGEDSSRYSAVFGLVMIFLGIYKYITNKIIIGNIKLFSVIISACIIIFALRLIFSKRK